MNKSRFPILIVAALLVLLCVLAFLQYRWLGQISDGERERLQRNLQADTQRFAEDFNREMQNAYFNFQLGADTWHKKDWIEFNERYKFWSERTAYPDLIKDFYLVELESQRLLHYNNENKAFQAVQWTEKLNKLNPKFTPEESFQPVAEEVPALLMPIHEMEKRFERIMVRTPMTEDIKDSPVETLKKYGVLIIELDEIVIKNQVLPDLVEKYFSENESANYKLAVTSKENQPIFQTANLTATDANARLFELSPDNFIFFANREMLSAVQGERRKTIVLSKTEIQKSDSNLAQNSNSRVEMQVTTNEKPRVRIFDKNHSDESAAWILNVQHSAGSLEQFITNTRRKNLALSFGILSLLGVSIVLIFLSAQRAKLFAQRQVDFVSSVSHEFRTPLAVIYSAGENLSDGVIREENKISNYGNLIKHEGKKLSVMVEQILEFAGAGSGKRKYDFRQVEIEKVITEAIAECQPAIEEKGFLIEKEIAENLPAVVADEKALTQAVQNLIHNALKYDDGGKWLKISAGNGDGKVRITVEDKGIGIEKKEIGKIFEPFFRAKSVVDAQIHGNGLGLSLVKQIVEAHKGEVKVESEAGKGSKFTIELKSKKVKK